MAETKRVYHWLHENNQGSVDAKWESEFVFLEFELPNTIKDEVNKRLEAEIGLKKADLEYRLRSIDPRDQRTLVAFDGHIPWGGLPKGGDIVGVQTLETIDVPKESIRKHRMHEEPSSQISFYRPEIYGVEMEKQRAEIHLKRYLLLLPKGIACVRKYRADSLSPIYVFIEVDEKGVTWRTSSY